MECKIITGYPSLDNLLGGGLRSGDVTVLAGLYDGYGPDTLYLNILFNNLFPNCSVNSNSEPVLLFSPYGTVDDKVADLSELDIEYIKNSINKLKELNFYIEDEQRLSVDDIVKRATELKERAGLCFIIIESFQTLIPRKPARHPFGDKNEAIRAANCIKQLSKELDVPILVVYYTGTRVDEREKVCKSMLEVANNLLSLQYDESTKLLNIDVKKNSQGTLGTVSLHLEEPYKRITE